MTRRTRIALGVVALGALGGLGVAARPWVMRRVTRDALADAASSHLACMLGAPTSAELDEVLLEVRAAAVTDPTASPWPPAQCDAWGEAAVRAWRDAGAWDATLDYDASPPHAWRATAFLAALRPFWTRSPDPKVPVAKRARFVYTATSAAPLFPNAPKLTSIETHGDRAILRAGDTRCAVARDLSMECTTVAGEPLEAETGATQLYFTSKGIADASGAVRAPAERGLWGRAFADRHLVVLDALDGALALRSVSAKGDSTVLAKLEEPASARSTQLAGGWLAWKALPPDSDGRLMSKPATLTVWNLRDAPAAKPIALGPVAPPKRPTLASPIVFGARTYGVCEAETTFVDMDPVILARKDGRWTRIDEPQATHARHLACDGDTAWLTSWAPLEIKKCTKDACAPFAFPTPSADIGDDLIADGAHVFHVRWWGTALVVTAQDQHDPTRWGGAAVFVDDSLLLKPLSYGRRWLAPITHAFAGRLIVAVHRTTSDARELEPYVFAVDERGAVNLTMK